MKLMSSNRGVVPLGVEGNCVQTGVWAQTLLTTERIRSSRSFHAASVRITVRDCNRARVLAATHDNVSTISQRNKARQPRPPARCARALHEIRRIHVGHVIRDAPDWSGAHGYRASLVAHEGGRATGAGRGGVTRSRAHR